MSRNTVRRALALLSKEGLLTKAGPRHRVAAVNADGPSKWLRQAIAVLVPAMEGSTPLYRQSWLDFISQGASEAVQAAGMHAISLNPRQLSPELVRRFAAEHPLGAVVPEIYSDAPRTIELINIFQEAGVPVVAYGGHPELSHVDRITSDHRMGSYLLTRWLISRGCKRIVNVFPQPLNRYWLEKRRAGYEEAMAEHHLPSLPTVELPPGPNSIQPAEYDAAVRHMATHLVPAFAGAEPVDALMLGTDRDAIVAGEACRIFKRQPGRDVTIVGYDNYLHFPEFTAAQAGAVAATVDKRNAQVGRELVSLLLDRVDGKLPSEPQCRVVPPSLVLTGGEARNAVPEPFINVFQHAFKPPFAAATA